MMKPESYMKDSYKIIWSRRAYNNLAKVISYLEENWTEKEIKKFSIELEQCLKIMQRSPLTFPVSMTKPLLRKAVITRHNTLFFKLQEHAVEVVNIFDTRQDPAKI